MAVAICAQVALRVDDVREPIAKLVAISVKFDLDCNVSICPRNSHRSSYTAATLDGVACTNAGTVRVSYGRP